MIIRGAYGYDLRALTDSVPEKGKETKKDQISRSLRSLRSRAARARSLHRQVVVRNPSGRNLVVLMSF